MSGEPTLRELFRPTGHPVAIAANVVQGSTYRITVLDAGLVRLEYSDDGVFEDRASKMAIDRDFPAAEFELTETDDRLEIRTARLRLAYDKQPFSAEGLSVAARTADAGLRNVWHFGVTPYESKVFSPTGNLRGTARTLDEIDGATTLEPGVLSVAGIAAVDDSRSVLLTEDGWIAPRRPGNLDLYVFAYGHDYKAALRALYKLTGPQPLLPRFALGNWWSRYYPYSAGEYLDLMDHFAAQDVPLSVGVIDMDWHLVDIDPRNGSGWTGYTWNPELFPDPPAFLKALHERGLKVSLNVHPAEGVGAHEKAYPAMARRMGVDPAIELPIAFDPTDPTFVQAYLEELHHPLEDEGVDFWWLDWQQGGLTKIPGLDPLWLLNHFHYLDSGRNGKRRLTFSRYEGIGSHRYPIGFSGDTVISWASLNFQPYFTATASNVGYGWWSHDIGGHFFGSKDDELTVRWVQLGVFSPIMRLHSSNSAFNTKEPWRFGEQAERIMEQFLRVRAQLVPYLYTMNRRAHEDGEPLVQPMYYDHPDVRAAYLVPNQFMFGDRLLVAPITTPIDDGTLLGSVRAWLPPGEWIDVFTGLTYRGDRTVHLHRSLDSIPVLAKAGAILVMVPPDRITFGTANPDALEIRVFAGADGEFVLAEDNDDEQWAATRITYTADVKDGASGANGGVARIHPVEGPTAVLPVERRIDLVLCGFARVESVSVTVDGTDRPVELRTGPVPGSVVVTLDAIGPATDVRVTVTGDTALTANTDVVARAFTLLDNAQIEIVAKEAAYAAVELSGAVQVGPEQVIAALLGLDLPEPVFAALSELILAHPPV